MAARQTQKQRQHSDVPENFWHREVSPLKFGRENFKITALRRGQDELSLDSQVESFDWAEDDSHVLSGSVTLSLPALVDFRKYRLKVGDIIRCQVGIKGQETFRELWRLRVSEPEYLIANRQYQWALVDDLERLSRTHGDFKYRKDKTHPHGWTGSEVIADVAKKFSFTMSRLPTLRHRFTNLTRQNVTPLEILGIVLRAERLATGTRFFMRYTAGRLAIQPYQRSREILILRGTYIDGTFRETLPPNYVNVLHVDGKGVKRHVRDKLKHKGIKRKPLTITLTNKDGVRTYGAIQRRIKAPSYVDTHDELRKYAAHALARDSKPTRELEFTHPGIPTLKRGDALQVTLDEVDLKDTIVYVRDVKHSVGEQNDYQMDVTVQFDDPFVKAQEQSDYQKRKDAAKRRHRKAVKQQQDEAHKRTTAKNPSDKTPTGTTREKGANKHADAPKSRHNQAGLEN